MEKSKISFSMAHRPQVVGVIWQVITPAVDAGLSMEDAKAIYTVLAHHYSRVDGRQFGDWRQEMLEMLNRP